MVNAALAVASPPLSVPAEEGVADTPVPEALPPQVADTENEAASGLAEPTALPLPVPEVEGDAVPLPEAPPLRVAPPPVALYTEDPDTEAVGAPRVAVPGGVPLPAPGDPVGVPEDVAQPVGVGDPSAPVGEGGAVEVPVVDEDPDTALVPLPGEEPEGIAEPTALGLSEKVPTLLAEGEPVPDCGKDARGETVAASAEAVTTPLPPAEPLGLAVPARDSLPEGVLLGGALGRPVAEAQGVGGEVAAAEVEAEGDAVATRPVADAFGVARAVPLSSAAGEGV